MRVLLAMLFFVTINSSFARGYSEWPLGNIDLPDLKINDLRFTNRARCALDSKKPTDSAFVLIGNLDIGTAMYRLARSTENNTSQLTKMGIQVYRYAVIQMLQHIHRKLMRGELPLLPVNTVDKNAPRTYSRISSNCRSDEYCRELDNYIENIWKISSSGNYNNLFQLDSFSAKHFISESIGEVENNELNCHYLKKFSPLQANLYGVKPNERIFEQIAQTNIKRDQYIGRCDDIDAQTNLKVASYQLDINSLKEKEWEEIGFNYWNSLKLYFSWAWRNAPEMEEMAAPFGDVFRAVEIEDSVLIVPTDCKSITPPSCDGDYLQLNTLREFAKGDYKKEALTTDVLKPIPEGPQGDLLEEEFPEVNTDILNLADHENAEKWMENFRNNWSGTREIMKRKLVKSINFLNIATRKIPVETLIEQVSSRFNKVLIEGVATNETAELKNELYYLCGEFTQAAHKEFSFLKGDLEILSKTTLVDIIADQFAKEKTDYYYTYYSRLATLISDSCNSLKQHEIWNDDFTLDKSGFSQWYLESIYEGKVQSTEKAILENYLKDHEPFLAYRGWNEGQKFEDVICANGPDCARKTLAAIIDLHAVAQYANTFWTMNQMVKSPAFFNPYAERTSCKVYDPWFKTKQLIFDLLNNVGQAAMSAFVPGAVFANMSLQPGRVVSFNQLIKEGKIEYDIKRKHASIFNGLVIDFGPLLGVPCSVNISKWQEDPYMAYTFSGISVGGCYNRERSDITVYSASEIEDPQESSINACASCTLNFESVAGSMTSISNIVPYAGVGLFLFEGLVRLYKSLKDPYNIPRKWKSNPNYVLDTYRRFGKIPKECVRKLRKGKQCLQNSKEEKVAEAIRNKIHGSIIGIDDNRFGSKAKVKVHGCNNWINVTLGMKENFVDVPNECKHLLKDI